jgi:AraC family transcriptional regulator
MMKHMKTKQLTQQMGHEIVLFQESSHAFDDLAAEILALARTDLPCMTMLLFGGAARVNDLAAALQMKRSAVMTTVERLQLAGYARYQPGSGPKPRVELTEHARQWIVRIWEPLREEGDKLCATFTPSQLTLLNAFISRARGIQEAHARKLRAWLDVPSSPARRSHLRGGLSPAALRRVQLFVEANLDRAIHLGDLAERAGLSPFHFARAFKTSAGMTPRAFIELRRIARAKELIGGSTQPLAAVAVESGFATQSRLTTAFKRHTGFTPAEYRRGRMPT